MLDVKGDWLNFWKRTLEAYRCFKFNVYWRLYMLLLGIFWDYQDNFGVLKGSRKEGSTGVQFRGT